MSGDSPARSPSPPRGRSPSRSPIRERSPRRSRSPARARSASPANGNLYVTGLSTRSREEDIRAAFGRYGTVSECRLVLDPRTRESRGFAFITMSAPEEADACITNLHKTDLDGRIIIVERARRARPRTPTPGKYMGRRPRDFDRRDDRGYDRRDRYSPRYDDRYRDSRDYRRSPPRYDDRYYGGRGRSRSRSPYRR